jgi:hypothetical protein
MLRLNAPCTLIMVATLMPMSCVQNSGKMAAGNISD